MASAVEMLVGGVVLLIGSALSGEHLQAMPPLEGWLALAYLIFFGSIIAFNSYMYLLKHVRPAAATSYAYVNPAVAVLLGIVFVGETIGIEEALAMLVIISAVVLIGLPLLASIDFGGGDDDPSDGRAHHAGAESEEQSRCDPLPERSGKDHPRHSERRTGDPCPHHQNCVAPIGVSGEKQLAEDPGKQPSKGDDAHLPVGESVLVADVSKKGEHAPIAERHECGEKKQQDHRPSERMRWCFRFWRHRAVVHDAPPISSST